MELLSDLLAEEPYLGYLGIEVQLSQAREVILRLPLRREVTNHLGLAHGGAQFSLGEATAIALAGMLFGEQARQVNLLTATATITYRRPARGELIGRATMSSEEASRLHAKFAEQGQVRFPVSVKLVDATNEVVTTLTVECAVLASS